MKNVIVGLKEIFSLEGKMRSTDGPLTGNITIWMNGLFLNDKHGFNYCYPTLNGLTAIVNAIKEDYEELDFNALSNDEIFTLLTDYDKFHAYILKNEPDVGEEDAYLFDSYMVQFDSDFDNYLIRCYFSDGEIIFLWKEKGKEELNSASINKVLFEQVIAEFENALKN